MSLMIETASNPATLAFGLPGGPEWIILLVLGLLIFGRRLPEVGRSLGRGIVEFKRGIKGIEDDIEDTSSKPGSLPSASESPKLDEGRTSEPAAARQPEMSEASVGSEGKNPYAPEVEPPRKPE